MKIVSGGQTGVDLAALDVARSLNIPWGGWAPKGWLREDGVIPDEYRWNGQNGLQEDIEPKSDKAHAAYVNRTRKNVEDSHFTLIYYRYRLSGGTLLTRDICSQIGKPHFCMDLDDYSRVANIEDTSFYLHVATAGGLLNSNKVINVAGPRHSKQPDIYRMASEVLTNALSPMLTR